MYYISLLFPYAFTVLAENAQELAKRTKADAVPTRCTTRSSATKAASPEPSTKQSDSGTVSKGVGVDEENRRNPTLSIQSGRKPRKGEDRALVKLHFFTAPDPNNHEKRSCRVCQ